MSVSPLAAVCPEAQVLLDLRRRFSGELARAIEQAASTEARLDALETDAPTPADARALVRELDAAGDQCRSAAHHIASAIQAASQIARLEAR